MSIDLTSSLESGGHALLRRLVGRWGGRARIWIEPGVLHDEDDVLGEMTALHGGRWVMHAYETQVDGADESGTALIGCVLPRGVWQVAWVDSWHTGTTIFVSEGPYAETDARIVVATTYAENPDDPPWGWRTEFVPGGETLSVRHYNVPPDGDEALAVEFTYTRR